MSPSAREAASLHDRATNRTGRFILRVELTMDSRLWPSSGQATNSPSSTRVPCSSPTGEPTAIATVPTCRHRGERYSGEPLLPDAPQTGSPNRRASYSHWPAHLVAPSGRDLAGTATPLSAAQLLCSSVGPPAQLVWPSMNSIPCGFLIDLV
jgi:hypothetical protein